MAFFAKLGKTYILYIFKLYIYTFQTCMLYTLKSMYIYIYMYLSFIYIYISTYFFIYEDKFVYIRVISKVYLMNLPLLRLLLSSV